MKKIFPSHNGLYLDLHSLEQIKHIARSTDVPTKTTMEDTQTKETIAHTSNV
jgi:hypothetical protein